MSKHISNLSATLASLGLIMAAILAVWVGKFAIIPSDSNLERNGEDLTVAEAFELGQYYFNHDEDPAGPYDLEQARRYYNLIVDENPRANNIVWYQLGRIDFLEGEFDAAIVKFNRQVELFGSSVPNVHYMLGLTYGYRASREDREEDWLKAETEFDMYLSFDRTSPFARTDLAWIYFSQGKYKEMLPVVEEGLEYHQENPWLLNMYGLALLNTGDAAEAYEQFKSASELADQLTEREWGLSYPGNDPSSWSVGLDSFRDLIEKNKELAAEAIE